MSNIKLSKSETQNIEQVMKSRSKSKPQKPKSKSKPHRNRTSKPDEVMEAQQTAQEAFSAMKKLLKPRSKSELIELVWTYGVQLQQLQHACQILLEENKELKGEKND